MVTKNEVLRKIYDVMHRNPSARWQKRECKRVIPLKERKLVDFENIFANLDRYFEVKSLFTLEV